MLYNQFIDHSKLANNRRQNGMTDATIRSMGGYVKKYETYATEYNFITFKSWLANIKLQASTKETIANTLGKFLVWNGYMSDSDFKKTKMAFKTVKKKYSTKEIDTQTVINCLRLCNFCRSPFVATRNRASIFLLATIGLRSSELIALTNDDVIIDNVNQIVRIFIDTAKQSDFSKDGLKEIRVKFGTMIGNYEVVDVLSRYQYQKQQLNLSTDAFFVTEKGTKLHVRSLEKFISSCNDEARKADKNKRITPHSFRHYTANRVTKKHGIYAAQWLLGHYDPKTTEKYVNPDRLELDLSAVEGGDL